MKYETRMNIACLIAIVLVFLLFSLPALIAFR